MSVAQGEDVLLPLATEVAVPLINMTVRGIGSVARPLVRDFSGWTYGANITICFRLYFFK